MLPTLKVVPPVSQARPLRLNCHRRESCAHREASSNEALLTDEWVIDPAIIAAPEAVEKWIESAEQEPVPVDNSDAGHDEVMNGSCWRELRAAREDLDRARVRYANAVRAARAVGFSWGEIGRLLGVPRQLVHRRFRNEVD